LTELINPIRQYVDGLIFTFHYPKDAGADYLELQKGCGEIIYAKFKQRHAFSMQQYLWQGPMENNDKFIQIDDKERLSPKFFEQRLPAILNAMDKQNIAMVANYGKGLVFKYNEQLEFRSSPHWYAVNLNGASANLELPQDEFWNVRNRTRDKFQFIFHYGKYFLYPAGSNHALLGLDHHPKGEAFFPEREKKRLEFREEMRKRGYPLTIDGLKDLLEKELDDKIKEFINFDKILNDFYKYVILKDETVVDNHNWGNMIILL
jgi:hypothetical protein